MAFDLKINDGVGPIGRYMANNDFKVLQIIEAKGWYAFGSTKQNQHVERWVRPVVCWVLIEDKKKEAHCDCYRQLSGGN